MCTKEVSKSDTGVRQHEAVLTTPLLPLCGSKKTKVVLSLGRLHPLKGLDLLIAAWAEIKRSSLVHECVSALVEVRGQRSEDGGQITNELLPWQLVIAGPDEQGTREKLEEISKKLKLKIAEASDLSDVGDADIVFMGPVHGEEKWALMKRADIFVLPSRSENFGIVVGEALSCGVPVVTTAVGPWGRGERSLARTDGRDQKQEKRGLCVVETSVEGIAQGLREMMALSDEERHELGQQGSEWVKQEFSWERVAKQMVEAYEGR